MSLHVNNLNSSIESMDAIQGTAPQANIVNVDQQEFVHQTTPSELELQGLQQCGEEEKPAGKNIDDVDEQVEDDDDDDDYDDDDDEKDNSQKLVIDIDDDEEVEEDDEKEIMDQNEVAIVLTHNVGQETLEKDLLNAAGIGKPHSSLRVDDSEAIITLSDAEDDMSTVDAIEKPGKIQKRKSVGAPLVSNEEERFRLKRRKINVEGAPKMPLTGYVRYMNDRRESARKEFPNKTNIEITKQIGEEWQSLPGGLKTEYLEAAEKDKKRYTSELHVFLKSRPDILASELAKNKIRRTDNNAAAAAGINSNTKMPPKEKPQAVETPKITKEVIKEKPVAKESHPVPSTSQNAERQQTYDKPRRRRTPTPPSTSASSSMSAAATAAGTTSTTAATAVTAAVFAPATNIIAPTPGEIPIFTNEFLEHNKLYDMELRSLRKSKTDLEQQNFVLEKHVENMKCGVEKMISENNEIQEKNRLLEIYLDKLKRKLAHALSSLPLPNAPNGATMDNIDKYMLALYKMSTSNSHGPATLNKAKDIIRKLDLQIQL